MASQIAISSASVSSIILGGGQRNGSCHHLCEDLRFCWPWPPVIVKGTISRSAHRGCLVDIFATQSAGLGTDTGTNPTPPRQRAPRPPPAAAGVDTRIHWENEDEGWIGGGSSKSQSSAQEPSKTEEQKAKNLLGEKFSELLNNSTDSHYQFLGVSAEAELEEIKSAYRRLSKEYHPDTTSLPLKEASKMFMKLRDAYDILSDEEKRSFYDWTLTQEAVSREAQKMRIKLEDPYMQQVNNWESIPDMVDRLGGNNLDLSPQAKSALTFDIFIILFAVSCIVYVLLFKEPYY